jgi:fumarate hydratase subunit beta
MRLRVRGKRRKTIKEREENTIRKLGAGEEVLFTGYVYTARDQAHKRLAETIKRKQKLPLNLKGQIIYYCGPTATPRGETIGSCGPTTSGRMDEFMEPLLKKGILGMIGKGRRSKKVHELIRKHKAVYFAAPAGCGALLAKKVLSKRLVCFKELGPEAIWQLKVKDFPLVVVIDSKGQSIYDDL